MTDMSNKDVEMAHEIALRVHAAGGSTYFVGGCVRDKLMGMENKDIDIEIHGISPETLGVILDSLGKRTEMGASFGIYGLRGYGLDIAMPRKEEATGRGHKDFAVYVDPYLGTYKAALRRDFTMNALMEDVLTGKVIDHFGGIEDLRKGVLRHVNSVTFVEDPLRVLRAAQFASRFGFTVAEETIALAKTMDLSALASERIMGELQKALVKAPKPSVFFSEMRKMEQLDIWFPELKSLIGVEQNPATHPEGDVWTHTMMVLDQAALRKDRASSAINLLMAALCHDMGKSTATKMTEKGLRAINHETEGVPLAKRFVSRLTTEVQLNKYVLNMVKLHMRPHQLGKDRASFAATNRMFDAAMVPKDLLLLSFSDRMGRDGALRDEQEERFLLERLELYEEIMSRPCVMGADLVKAGLRPGPAFSEVLAFAHDLHLCGVEKEKALPQVLAYARERGITVQK